MLNRVALLLLPKEQNAISISSYHLSVNYIYVYMLMGNGFFLHERTNSIKLMSRRHPTWVLYTVACARA